MSHTTSVSRARNLIGVLAPAVLLWAAPAQAAEEDLQVWFYYNSVVPLDDRTSATIEVSPRWRDEGPDILQTRVTFDVEVAPSFEIGAGAAYVEYAGGAEYRPHQQVSFDVGPLSFRTRLEERFFSGNARPQIRLRQRVGTEVPLAENTKLTGNVEYLHNVRPERRGDEARIDSWRGLIGIKQKLSPTFTIEGNYHIIYAPREGKPDRISHIPRVTLTHRY